MQSIEPGISRFRVWSFGPSRNDDVEFVPTFTRRSGRVLSQSKPSTTTWWKRPDEHNSFENISRLSRRVLRGLGLEEDASADAGGGASAGHPDLHRARRTRASG